MPSAEVAHAAQLLEVVQVDEDVGRRRARLHHVDQRLAAGERARAVVRREQARAPPRRSPDERTRPRGEASAHSLTRDTRCGRRGDVCLTRRVGSRIPYRISPSDLSGRRPCRLGETTKGVPDAAAAVVTERPRGHHHEPMALQGRSRRRSRRSCRGRRRGSTCFRNSAESGDAHQVRRSAADPAGRAAVGAGSLRHDDDAGDDAVQQPAARDTGVGIRRRLPRPTIEARTGQPITVTWINNLPTDAPAGAVHRLHARRGDAGARTCARPRTCTAGTWRRRATAAPTAWFLPGQQATVLYPNDQDAATLWYHDHAMGITRLNPYAGLAGFYLVRDAYEDPLDLPSGQYEIPLVDPGQAVQHRRHAHRTPAGHHAPGVAAGDVRRHDRRQRQAVALPERRAAQVPPPHPQRLERAVLLAHDRRAEEGNEVRAALQPDRRRGRAVARRPRRRRNC